MKPQFKILAVLAALLLSYSLPLSSQASTETGGQGSYSLTNPQSPTTAIAGFLGLLILIVPAAVMLRKKGAKIKK